MLKFKDILEGLFEGLLELPAAWARTHWALLYYGARAPMLIDRRARREGSGYLGLATAAFIDTLVLAAIFGADSAYWTARGAGEPAVAAASGLAPRGEPTFWEHFLSGLTKLFSDPFGNQQVVATAVLLFAIYYAYYIALTLLRMRPNRVRLLAAACLFAGIAALAFAVVTWLWAFGRGLPLPIRVQEGVLALAFYAVVGRVFLPLGWTTMALLGRRHRVHTAFEAAACGIALVVIFFGVVYLLHGAEIFWPSLTA